jgi:hypothetical protein
VVLHRGADFVDVRRAQHLLRLDEAVVRQVRQHRLVERQKRPM